MNKSIDDIELQLKEFNEQYFFNFCLFEKKYFFFSLILF